MQGMQTTSCDYRGKFAPAIEIKMLTDTPCTEMTGLKKPGRLKIRRAQYDENDSVMKDIQERMKQKRRKKADLSRSRRLNITNASLMLKLSLRANNRALAKALEDAHCEARQDKEMIFELQCALEAAQHELRQCHQMIQDLKLEGQSMIGMLTTLQESEESHRKRVAEVKTLLNEVTAKYLLNTVALIDKAADICNTPSLSKASSIFIRKSSVSEDDSSRDTFSALMPETQGIARSNIYCRNSKTAIGEEASSEIPSEPVAEEQPNQAGSHVNESIATDEATIPASDSQTDFQLKRRSSASRKRSRTAFFLDPKEMQHALASEVGHQSQICEEKEELSCSVSEFAAHCMDDRPQEAAVDDPENEMGDKCQEVAVDDPENERDKIVSVDSVSNTGKVEIGDKDQCALEKTDYREQDMELTSKDEKNLQVETSQGDVTVQITSEVEKTQEREVVKENRTAKKPKAGVKKNGKVKKNLAKKHLKKVSVKKAILKAGDEGMNQGTSVFDLSESFSQPVSPHQHQKEKKFEQNLSTESEKSEPGETSSSGVSNRSDGHVGGSVEMRELEGEKEMNVEDEPPVETLEEEDRPKTCRRSRQSHGTLQLVPLNTDEVTNEPIRDTVLASPLCEELSVPQRTLKPLSQILNESSCRELGSDNENSNALSIKAKLHKKTIKPKQKKRLYDPKKSLDKEFTHNVINSSQDLALPYPENATNRNSSKFKRRQRSGTVGKEERAKEIFNESLSGLLEESWMKDFLNDIDSEDEGKFTARTSAPRKKSQVKTRATRKTFKVSSTVSNEEESRPLMESNGNSLMNDEPLETEDHMKKVKDGKVIRRGTVCLAKGSEEDFPADGYSELSSRLSRGCDVDAGSRICDDMTIDRMPGLMAGKGRVKNFASFVLMDEKNKDPVVEKGRNVVRRGTFDIEPLEEEEDSNMGIKVDDKKEQSENKGEKKDKNEGKQKKRKSDIMEKDVEEVNGDTHGRKSRKRQKRDKEDEEWMEAEEEDQSEDSEMVKKPRGRGSKRLSARSNHRRKTHNVEKVESNELAEISEDEEGVLQVVDDLESKDRCNDECEEKCLQLKPSKVRDGSLTELAKSDQKPSKISKVPRLKKKIIVEDSSEENASHDDSISSVESVSAKPEKAKKQSGIPRRKEGSKSLQKFYGNVKRRENDSVMNGSCLKMKHLPAEAKLDKDMDVPSQGIISASEDRKAVTLGEKEKAKEVVTDTLGRKSEMSVDKGTLRESKDETAENKNDEERDLAKEKIQEEGNVIKKHVTVDKEERCDTEDVCEVNESGDASTSIPEETKRIEETGQAETGRRPSRQARAKAAQSLKEPSLSRKLRRGDPFTDNMLLTSPMVKNRKVKKNKKVNQIRKPKPALGDATNVI